MRVFRYRRYIFADGPRWAEVYTSTDLQCVVIWEERQQLGTWRLERNALSREEVRAAIDVGAEWRVDGTSFAGDTASMDEALQGAKRDAESIALRYLGLLEPMATYPERYEIRSFQDVLNLPVEPGELLTYVVDDERRLWVADRRSEHVYCSRFRDVFAAGEIAFQVDDGHVAVSYSSNQSTGFCPPRRSWNVLVFVLQRCGIDPGGSWTHPFVFRRCERCNEINLVKDGHFECGSCDTPLPCYWNFSPYIYELISS